MKNILNSFSTALAALIITGLYTYSGHSIAQVQRTSPSTLDQSGYYPVQIGDVKVIALSDGTITIDLNELLTNVKPGEVDGLSRKGFQSAKSEASVNAYLIKTNNKLILVDAGTAELYGPTLGHLTESLKKIGYRPEQIDAVLVTHIHTDHTGGLMLGNKMVFPNATIYISKPEVDFWLNEKSRKKAPKRLSHWFDEAETKVGPYLKAGKVKNFEYGKEIFPGITPIAAPGHTPGHTFYSLVSRGQKIVFMGDIIHGATVQFPDPSVTIKFDVDPKQAAVQRKKAFADAARSGYWIACDHVSFPGIGHLRSGNNGGFIWIPINFSTLGTGQ